MTCLSLHVFMAAGARLAAAVVALAGPATAQSPDVGSTIANPAVLGRMFANVCIGVNSMEQADAALRSVGMLDNPETGTFFHQQFDLSLNPGGGTCSMVFVTDQPGAFAIEIFGKTVVLTHPDAMVDVDMSHNETDGEVYVRAGYGVDW